VGEKLKDGKGKRESQTDNQRLTAMLSPCHHQYTSKNAVERKGKKQGGLRNAKRLPA